MLYTPYKVTVTYSHNRNRSVLFQTYTNKVILYFYSYMTLFFLGLKEPLELDYHLNDPPHVNMSNLD